MAGVVGERATDGGDVDPVMDEEARVLCRDDGTDERGAHVVERDPAFGDRGAADDHQRGERRIDEAVDDHRAGRDEDERGGNPGSPGEKPAAHT